MEPIVLRAANKKGNGLFATQYYSPGDRILHELSCIIQAPLQFVNHSCDPNCELQLLLLLAKKHINKGDELTMDYEKVEFFQKPMFFDCQCGSPDCRGKIEICQYGGYTD